MQLPNDQRRALPRIRWIMLSFAFLATVLNYVHRLAFTYLTANGELRKLIPDAAFGYIATAFFVAYMISNMVSGFLIDKLGTRIGYSLCMAFWTTAGLLHAVALVPFQFGICRFLLGLGEAGNWPSAIKLVREWFPPHERSTATGIFNSGGAVGAIVAPPLLAWLGGRYGRQAAFVLLGLVGYLWLAVFWFFYRTPQSADKQQEVRVPVRTLLRSRFVICFTISKVFIDPVWYFITFWIGRYLADVHGMSLVQIGSFAIIPFVVADIGNILGGLFTQFIIKKGLAIPRARKLAALVFGSIMIASLIAGPLIIHSSVTALIVLAAAVFGYSAYTANSMVFPSDVVPSSATASVWGLASVGAGLGGALFQLLSGLALNRLSHRLGYPSAYNIVFVGYGIASLVGILIVLFVMGPIDRSAYLHGLPVAAAGGEVALLTT